MIEDVLEEAHQKAFFRDYMGQAAWHVTSIEHVKVGTENDMPQYVVAAHPEKMPKEQTAEEIINGVLEKLG